MILCVYILSVINAALLLQITAAAPVNNAGASSSTTPAPAQAQTPPASTPHVPTLDELCPKTDIPLGDIFKNVPPKVIREGFDGSVIRDPDNSGHVIKQLLDITSAKAPGVRKEIIGAQRVKQFIKCAHEEVDSNRKAYYIYMTYIPAHRLSYALRYPAFTEVTQLDTEASKKLAAAILAKAMKYAEEFGVGAIDLKSGNIRFDGTDFKTLKIDLVDWRRWKNIPKGDKDTLQSYKAAALKRGDCKNLRLTCKALAGSFATIVARKLVVELGQDDVNDLLSSLSGNASIVAPIHAITELRVHRAYRSEDHTRTNPDTDLLLSSLSRLVNVRKISLRFSEGDLDIANQIGIVLSRLPHVQTFDVNLNECETMPSLRLFRQLESLTYQSYQPASKVDLTLEEIAQAIVLSPDLRSITLLPSPVNYNRLDTVPSILDPANVTLRLKDLTLKYCSSPVPFLPHLRYLKDINIHRIGEDDMDKAREDLEVFWHGLKDIHAELEHIRVDHTPSGFFQYLKSYDKLQTLRIHVQNSLMPCDNENSGRHAKEFYDEILVKHSSTIRILVIRYDYEDEWCWNPSMMASLEKCARLERLCIGVTHLQLSASCPEGLEWDPDTTPDIDSYYPTLEIRCPLHDLVDNIVKRCPLVRILELNNAVRRMGCKETHTNWAQLCQEHGYCHAGMKGFVAPVSGEGTVVKGFKTRPRPHVLMHEITGLKRVHQFVRCDFFIEGGVKDYFLIMKEDRGHRLTTVTRQPGFSKLTEEGSSAYDAFVHAVQAKAMEYAINYGTGHKDLNPGNIRIEGKDLHNYKVDLVDWGSWDDIPKGDEAALAAYASYVIKQLDPEVVITRISIDISNTMLLEWLSGSCALPAPTWSIKELYIRKISVNDEGCDGQGETDTGNRTITRASKHTLISALSSLPNIQSVWWSITLADLHASCEVGAVISSYSQLKTLDLYFYHCAHMSIPAIQLIGELESFKVAYHEVSGASEVNWKSLDDIAQVISQSPGLRKLAISLSANQSGYLDQLLCYPSIKDTRKLRLRTMELRDCIPSLNLLPHFHHLRNLSVLMRIRLSQPEMIRYKTASREFWSMASNAGITLNRITVDYVPKDLIEYLKSYRGLQSLRLYDVSKMQLEPHDNMAMYLNDETFCNHKSSLATLVVRCEDGEEWCWNAQIQSAISRCASLEHLSIGVTFSQLESSLPIPSEGDDSIVQNLQLDDTAERSVIHKMLDHIVQQCPSLRTLELNTTFAEVPDNDDVYCYLLRDMWDALEEILCAYVAPENVTRLPDVYGSPGGSCTSIYFSQKITISGEKEDIWLVLLWLSGVSILEAPIGYIKELNIHRITFEGVNVADEKHSHEVKESMPGSISTDKHDEQEFLPALKSALCVLRNVRTISWSITNGDVANSQHVAEIISSYPLLNTLNLSISVTEPSSLPVLRLFRGLETRRMNWLKPLPSPQVFESYRYPYQYQSGGFNLAFGCAGSPTPLKLGLNRLDLRNCIPTESSLLIPHLSYLRDLSILAPGKYNAEDVLQYKVHMEAFWSALIEAKAPLRRITVDYLPKSLLEYLKWRRGVRSLRLYELQNAEENMAGQFNHQVLSNHGSTLQTLVLRCEWGDEWCWNKNIQSAIGGCKALRRLLLTVSSSQLEASLPSESRFDEDDDVEPLVDDSTERSVLHRMLDYIVQQCPSLRTLELLTMLPDEEDDDIVHYYVIKDMWKALHDIVRTYAAPEGVTKLPDIYGGPGGPCLRPSAAQATPHPNQTHYTMPPLQFLLSSALDSLMDDVDNAVFSVDGKPIYSTNTPLSVSKRITTLQRLHRLSPASSTHAKELEAKGEEPPPPSYDQLFESEGTDGVKIGEIEYHEFSPTIFRYEGKTVDEHHMFLKTSFLNSFLVGDRKFTAPDGRTYVWQVGLDGMELGRYHEHDKKTDVVATWSPRRFGILHNKPVPPCLEILPEAQHMIDLIFLTFIFVHYENQPTMFTFHVCGDPDATTRSVILHGKKVYQIRKENYKAKRKIDILRLTSEPTVTPHVDPTDISCDDAIASPFSLHANPPLGFNQEVYHNTDDFDENELEEGPDRLQPLTIARLKFRSFQPCRITFHGHKVSDGAVFPRFGLLSELTNIAFAGPDLKRYRWYCTDSGLRLDIWDAQFRTSDSKVAEWLSETPNQQEKLVIYPRGAHMVDFIVMAFVYTYETLIIGQRT
ncbi:hypothetical protein CVT24_005045 [Panaeolus cyanescens]|uniref:DUF6593 domain-containing protein n=1 Tax=Panaeolus cyanescens TaxID=181874 RepID=A0A409VPR8_9AGAR|nr:hypothetical protein CVT24_005045 [Panaeolus cyanescens]